MGQLDCRGSTSRQINCPFMNWVSPPKTLSDCSMLWVGTLNVPVRLNIGAKNVFWVEVAAKQRGGWGGVCRGNDTGKHHCRHLFHGSPDKVFNPEIWVRVWTSLSHLHFTHFSYFGGAKKKQCRLLSLPIRNLNDDNNRSILNTSIPNVFCFNLFIS